MCFIVLVQQRNTNTNTKYFLIFNIIEKMQNKILYCHIAIFIIILNRLECAKILAIFPLYCRSHYNMFEPVLKTLAERGHEVDVLSHFPLDKPPPRFNVISLQGILPKYVGTVSIHTLSQFNNVNIYQTVYNVLQTFGIGMCDKLFNSTKIRDLYKNIDKIRYDLIITEVFSTDCLLAFANKLNVPIIGMSSCLPPPWIYDRFGLPDSPAVALNHFINTTPPYSFFQRVYKTMVRFMMKWSFYYIQTVASDEIIRTALEDPNLPSMYEMQKRFSLLLTNTHYSLYGAYPMPPNVKEVGGIHIIFDSLPKHFEEILNNSRNGVILFSMGSVLKMDTFAPEKQRSLIEAFGELPYDIIWKGDKSKLIGPFPNNIHFEPWISQREILCHPNITLFITHGGLLGTWEAIHCGVPMVSIPIAFDQQLNTKLGIDLGITIGLNYEDITKENVLNTLNTILNIPSYRHNIKRVSKIFRNRPMTPMDTAIYWIEYVIRYKGAYHLRPKNVELPWYQLYLFDVFFICISVMVSLLIVIYLIVHLIFNRFIKLIKEMINLKIKKS